MAIIRVYYFYFDLSKSGRLFIYLFLLKVFLLLNFYPNFGIQVLYILQHDIVQMLALLLLFHIFTQISTLRLTFFTSVIRDLAAKMELNVKNQIELM